MKTKNIITLVVVALVGYYLFTKIEATQVATAQAEAAANQGSDNFAEDGIDAATSLLDDF